MNFLICIGRKRRATAKNGKTVNETQPNKITKLKSYVQYGMKIQ